MAEGPDGRDLDAPTPPDDHAEAPTPDGSVQDEESRDLQQENAETSLDQPSS